MALQPTVYNDLVKSLKSFTGNYNFMKRRDFIKLAGLAAAVPIVEKVTIPIRPYTNAAMAYVEDLYAQQVRGHPVISVVNSLPIESFNKDKVGVGNSALDKVENGIQVHRDSSTVYGDSGVKWHLRTHKVRNSQWFNFLDGAFNTVFFFWHPQYSFPQNYFKTDTPSNTSINLVSDSILVPDGMDGLEYTIMSEAGEPISYTVFVNGNLVKGPTIAQRVPISLYADVKSHAGKKVNLEWEISSHSWLGSIGRLSNINWVKTDGMPKQKITKKKKL